MSARTGPGFLDSDCDVAALVYAPGEDPAPLLRDLAASAETLLVLDHFGAAELDALADAAEHDIPVLVTVPEARFRAWLDATGGLAVRLPCSRAGLERWWRGLGALTPPRPTMCERLK